MLNIQKSKLLKKLSRLLNHHLKYQSRQLNRPLKYRNKHHPKNLRKKTKLMTLYCQNRLTVLSKIKSKFLQMHLLRLKQLLREMAWPHRNLQQDGFMVWLEKIKGETSGTALLRMRNLPIFYMIPWQPMWKETWNLETRRCLKQSLYCRKLWLAVEILQKAWTNLLNSLAA